MNLIQAYKQAKVGEYVKLPGKMQTEKHDDGGKKIRDMIRDGINVEMLFSDNWQIERKPQVWEGEVVWVLMGGDTVAPGSSMGANSEIRQLFEGKRTKLRIEEIIDREE